MRKTHRVFILTALTSIALAAGAAEAVAKSRKAKGKKAKPTPAARPSPTPAATPTATPAAAPVVEEKTITSEKPLATLIPPAKGAKQIPSLTLKTEPLYAKRVPFGDDPKIFVILDGHYSRKGYNLLRGNDRVRTEKGGNFRIEVPVTGPATTVELRSIGPRGQMDVQKVDIAFETFADFKKTGGKPPRSFYLSAAIGPSFIGYKDTRIPDYSTIAITGKVTYVHALPSKNWDFGGTVYLTLLPITKSHDVTVRFLGINARYGYVLPMVKDPWRVSIMAGVYYTTMFVSNNRFGFRDMAGPQLFPVVRRTLPNGDFANAYLKFSPVTADLSVLALSNNERAIGVSYVRPITGGRSISSISGSIDLAMLGLVIDGVTIESSSLSISAGFGF